MQRRTFIIAGGSLLLLPSAWAHHGWSSFDQNRPIYLEGKAAQVNWRNPHAELVLELPSKRELPLDMATRTVPPQSASVDSAALFKAARLPTRQDPRWTVELAPLSRLESWKVPEIRAGETVGVLGFTFTGEKGDAVLRAEYLFVGGKAYGLRSSPA